MLALSCLPWFVIFLVGYVYQASTVSQTTPATPAASLAPMPAATLPTVPAAPASTPASQSGLQPFSQSSAMTTPAATTTNRSKASSSTAAPTAQKPATQKQPTAAASPDPNVPERWRNSKAALSIDMMVEMQVAIAENADSLAIGTSNGGQVLDANGQVLHGLTAEQSYTVQPDGQTIDFGSKAVPSVVWIEPTAGGYVYVRDHWYPGRVLLISQEGGLLAVNYVMMRDYLASVVGGEVSPSWPMDALKAQAVAARSYALTYYFRPATSLYHLGDSQSYQVYGGADKVTDTTYAAVDATAGEFISYKGGIVESLYAASDDIVAAAHGGRGMSQLGALKLSEEGYDYLHILGTYYPGTGLGRIEMEHE